MRIGIVGCGRVGETCHLPALRSLGGSVQVMAVADTDEHRRRRVAGVFDVAHTFPDADAILASALPIDVMAVCTPAQFHAGAVVAALQAGKHVLVEKPLALTLDDADRMLAAQAAAAPHLKVMLGFNLRHHRLIRKARQMIASGIVGDVQVVRTLWTSGIRGRMKLPQWRNRRQTGGGVLAEIAVHHIDLIRYLTGTEVEQVFATSEHGEGDDETAALTMRLSTGATVSCVFSERTGDANELEVHGPKGKLAFSIYRFDSLTFTPTSTYGGRLGHLVRTLKDMPEVWPILRRGGDFRDTYRQEWMAFLDALRHDQPVPASIEDGRQVLRVVLVAGASANAGRPVAIADAPRQPEPVPAHFVRSSPHTDIRTQTEEPDATAPDAAPRLSAIIATRGSIDSIRRTLRHLRAQTVATQIELLIICPSESNLGLEPADVDGFFAHRVVEVGPITSIARANAAGIRAASAPIVVLCEDHAFPDPQWAEALLVAHRGPYAVVGPVVHNANPTTMVSWADCLIGYGPWLEPIRPCEPSHLPGHNSSYKRHVLLSYGDRLDEMMEAETVLQWDLRARGQRLYLDPTARLAHTNFALLGIWTKVQFHAGRMFGATRAMGWPLWKRMLFACASPLIPLVRMKRIWGQARRINGRHHILPQVLPALLWGLVMDGLGQMAGYAAGAGRSRQMIAHYEFDRIRFITTQDRRHLATAEPVVSQT